MVFSKHISLFQERKTSPLEISRNIRRKYSKHKWANCNSSFKVFESLVSLLATRGPVLCLVFWLVRVDPAVFGLFCLCVSPTPFVSPPDGTNKTVLAQLVSRTTGLQIGTKSMNRKMVWNGHYTLQNHSGETLNIVPLDFGDFQQKRPNFTKKERNNINWQNLKVWPHVNKAYTCLKHEHKFKDKYTGTWNTKATRTHEPRVQLDQGVLKGHPYSRDFSKINFLPFWFFPLFWSGWRFVKDVSFRGENRGGGRSMVNPHQWQDAKRHFSAFLIRNPIWTHQSRESTISGATCAKYPFTARYRALRPASFQESFKIAQNSKKIPRIISIPTTHHKFQETWKCFDLSG